MKKNALFLLLLIVATTMSGQTLLNGDLNHDGVIDIADVTAIVNVAVGKSQAEVVNVASVVLGDHEYMDLGLPSGTLWATCNIGAENPEDYGDYFAWGETFGYNMGKTTFDLNTYQHYADNGDEEGFIKYCSDSDYGYNGFTDTLTVLQPEDAAAYVNWGSEWRMPSVEQFKELLDNRYTYSEWTTVNGVEGRKITSKKNWKSLFLPAAGYCSGKSLFDTGSYGDYWSRTLSTSYPGSAYILYFDSSNVDWGRFYRYDGQSVRPVRAQ